MNEDTKISSEWLHDERLNLISDISSTIHILSQSGIVPRKILLETMELITFLSTKGSRFLEANRDQFVNWKQNIKKS